MTAGRGQSTLEAPQQVPGGARIWMQMQGSGAWCGLLAVPRMSMEQEHSAQPCHARCEDQKQVR